jgi:pimeloyl-ACP methyl ester carboxylesterase
MPKIITRIILLLFVLMFYGCNVQRNMLYYPSTYVPSQSSLSAYNMQFWPSDPNDYRGFISTPQANKVKGTIMVFHGNAGTAADRVYYVNALTRLDYRVILAEYPGYGGRKGELGEETFVRDAKETLRIASEKFGGPIFILGESLGCGVAAAAAKDSPVKIEGIILITPWDTLLSVAREKVAWLPVRLFLRDKYDSIGNLKEYQGRIVVVGAEQDVVIPIQHAQALFQSLPGAQLSRKMYTIKGAGHNDWPGMVDLAWWKEIADYIQGDL